MKGIPLQPLLVKVAWGVFQRCVETTLEKNCLKIIENQDMMTKAGKPRFFVQQISLCWYLATVDCGSEKGALHDFICVIVTHGNLWIGLHCTWTSHVFLKSIYFDLRNNTNHVPSSVHCTHHLRWSLVPHELLEASARWACDTWLPTVNKWRSSWWFL